jgi:hypothetical protein
LLKDLDLQRYRIDFICLDHNFVVGSAAQFEKFLIVPVIGVPRTPRRFGTTGS